MARAAGFVSTVFEMLKEDHDKVKKLFEDFESAEGRERGEIAKTAIQELEIHADLEERLIYPAIRAEVDAADMMDEAMEEEEGEMFPKAEECDMDWESLEASVMKRKGTLLAKASGRKTGARPSRKTIR